MKKFIVLFLLLSGSYLIKAQGNLSYYNSGTQQWIKLGVLTLAQQGNDAYFKFIGGSGYNASVYQQGYITMHLRTSNAGSLDANGYAFSATATSYESSKFLYDVRIVPNASGGSATAYTIYIYCAPYPGSSYFTVESPMDH